MKHFISKTSSDEAFVLFHGTGGNEFSLLFLTGELNPHANIISFIGSVATGTHRRYFAPLIDGKIQIEDFNARVDEFLNDWHSLDLNYNKITFIGYSNGANFIQGIIEKDPDIADEIILLHPQNSGFNIKKSGRINRILITTGANDPLVVPGHILSLKKTLSQTFHNVKLIITDGQHGVDDKEVLAIKNWYDNK